MHGYIDKTGRLIIKPKFDWAGDFSDGLARVGFRSQVGYIDTTGKFVWNPLAPNLPLRKLVRGVANTTLGWLYAPRAFKDCYDQAGGIMQLHFPPVDVPWCLVETTIGVAGREVWGLIEVMTFPVPWPKRSYGSPYVWWDYPWEGLRE